MSNATLVERALMHAPRVIYVTPAEMVTVVSTLRSTAAIARWEGTSCSCASCAAASNTARELDDVAERLEQRFLRAVKE